MAKNTITTEQVRQTGVSKGTQHTSKSNIAQTENVLLIDMGRISDLKWPGPVSAETVIEKSHVTKERINEATKRINEFYVYASHDAPTRCIDGRQDPKLNPHKLGPQVPGGAAGAAIAYRLGVDKDDLTRGTFLNDAETMLSNFLRLGFPLGGHRDEHSLGKHTAGCGAIDSMDVMIATMTDPKLVDDHKRVVKLLMGPQFNRDNYLRVMGAAVLINGRSKDYFRGREAVIDMIEKKSPGGISTLKGDHNECIVVVNLVPNTTLDSNMFSDSFKGMQAFGYDIWRSLEMAQRIMPRPDDAVDRERFVMARVMSTVATLMALTDGSQRLIVRMPADYRYQ